MAPAGQQHGFMALETAGALELEYPARLVEPAAWVGHIPFALWLIGAARPNTVVELGVHTGNSYCAFLQAVRALGLDTRCFGVDHWQGDPHAGHYDDEVYHELRAYHDPLYGTFSTLLRSSFEDAVQYFSDGSIDLLHIDGFHTYGAVSADFQAWLPKVSSRGIALFHDTNVRERGFGIWQFWEELTSRYPHFEFSHCHGLGIVYLGSEPLTGALKALFTANTAAEREVIQNYFARLGVSVVERLATQRLAAELGRMKAQENALQLEPVAANAGMVPTDLSTTAVANLSAELQAPYLEFVELFRRHESVKDSLAARDLALGEALKTLSDRDIENAALARDLAAAQASVVKLAEAVAGLNLSLAKTLTGLPGLEDLALADIARIRTAFDSAYYLEKYPDIRASGIDPFEHYMTAGWREKRDPSRDFSTSFYLRHAPDVAATDVNPFVHWVLHGIGEKRASSEADESAVSPAAERSSGLEELVPSDVERVRASFDEAYYLEQYPELRASDFDPFEHYMRVGWKEGRDPSCCFSTNYYLLHSKDVAEAGANPFVHWVLHGIAEKRPPSEKGAVALAMERPSGLEGLAPSDVERVRMAFDEAYYLEQYPELKESDVDPFQHYMRVGWREGREPSPYFSTSYYLRHQQDIAAAGVNPFVHWVLHGFEENRQALSFHRRISTTEYAPKVSAIVPNYNHARFLSRRIESILGQSYRNLEILILDDCSNDESRAVIERYCQEYPDRIGALFNEENSGNVFKQWRKGIDNSDGEILWICESDDFCEPDFLEKLVPYFRDESINLAFGRIQETDSDGNVGEHLDDYREQAEPGIWNDSLIRPARQWFANALGVRNVIANVGGSLWRRVEILDSVWREAQTYSVVGDWYLYCHVAGGGQIAWEPKAISYFRRLATSTSASSFERPSFYQELERFMLNLRRQWDVPDQTVENFYGKLGYQYYSWFKLGDKIGRLENHCDKRKILAQRRTRPHILMAFYGFIFGGGELFPVELANYLHAKGWLVSMLAFDTELTNPKMRAALNPAIPVYVSAWVTEFGADRFVAEAGISLIHSHTLGSELWFFENWALKTDIPYLVTLHGSYEATNRAHLPDERIARLVNRVSHFVYTADKNLKLFDFLELPRSALTKLPNAMPVDPQPFPKTREDLGIAPDAIVYTLVARGIPEKGWQASIAAFVAMREKHPDRALHLLLCGEGDEVDRLYALHGADPDITFLGFQTRIHGLYRLSDVAIVPSRFSGESYPLCIIQAFQSGTPVIGSRVGEIATMLAPPDEMPAGVLIEPYPENELFVRALQGAMEIMLAEARRNEYAKAARMLGRGYSMDRLVDVYCRLYESLLANTQDGARGECTTALESRVRSDRTASLEIRHSG
jgi:glycosyltransferase involved in cell wall biosynthesis